MQASGFQDQPEANVTGTWGNINASLNGQNTSPSLQTSQCNHAFIPESLLHKLSKSVLSLECVGTQISVPSDKVQELRCIGHPKGKSHCDVPLFLNGKQTQSWKWSGNLILRSWSIIQYIFNNRFESTSMMSWIKLTILSNIMQSLCSVCCWGLFLCPGWLVKNRPTR